MSVKSLYPTIRPSLNLDFAKSKRLDPRITFTRGSTATYVDSDGLIKTAASNVARFDHNPVTEESLGLLVEESRTNILPYSSRFEQSSISRTYWNWGNINPYKVMNYDIAPDGNITAYLLNFGQIVPAAESWGTGGNTNLRYNTSTLGLTLTNGTQYIFSIYVKRANINPATHIRITINDGSTWTGSTTQKYTLTDNWQRITFSRTVNATGTLNIHVGALTNVPDNDTDCYGNVLLWGGQLEAGSFETSYISSTDTFTSRASTATYYNSAGTLVIAGINVARSDTYFPDSNGVIRSAGLLLEREGTNLLTYSQEFDNAAWQKANSTITANSAAAPDGTTTADTFAASAVDSYVYRTFNLSAIPYTMSVYAKANTATSIRLDFVTAGFALGASCTFNLSTGTAGTITHYGSSTGFFASIQKLPNGWYRCSITGTATATTWYYELALVSNSGNNLYIWGAQLESNVYLTSYIPTTASTVTRSADVSTSAAATRSADVATLTGTNFTSWYNYTEGTLFSDFISRGRGASNVAYPSVINASGSTSNWFGGAISGVGAGTVTPYAYVSSNSVFWQPSIVLTIANATRIKMALAGKSADMAFTTNGVSPLTNSTQLMPINPNQLQLNQYEINGTIAKITYWPTRLSNTVLQAITL